MSRWSRARATLDLPAGSRVLDLGCAFGFGTRLLTGRYQAHGHDLSGAYIEKARRTVPGARFTCGPADRVPYPNEYFDAVILLDVLEHVPSEESVMSEVARLLRPGGKLILSVPNTGALAGCDSLNVYVRCFPNAKRPPTHDPSWPAVRAHRHYSCRQVGALLEPTFRVRSVQYTGLGLAELVNLPLLIAFRGLLPLRWVYDAAQYCYFGVYLLEDLLPAGNWGYHMMLTAERL